MDEPRKIDDNYREKFEKLATRKGEIIAIVSNNHGEQYGLGEKFLLKSFLTALEHNEKMPDDLRTFSNHVMEVTQEARAAIQDYKRRSNRSVPY